MQITTSTHNTNRSRTHICTGDIHALQKRDSCSCINIIARYNIIKLYNIIWFTLSCPNIHNYYRVIHTRYRIVLFVHVIVSHYPYTLSYRVIYTRYRIVLFIHVIVSHYPYSLSCPNIHNYYRVIHTCYRIASYPYTLSYRKLSIHVIVSSYP